MLEQWFWENTVRWTGDGSALYFSQGPLVFGVATDGSRAGVVADASSIWRPPDLRDVVVHGPMTSFDISPQGGRLVYAICAIEQNGRREQQEQPRYAIAVAGLDGSSDRQLIGSRGFANYPAWSPDGSWIAYLATSRDDKFYVSAVRKTHIEVVGADGSGQRRISTEHPVVLHPPQWSPDGTRLAVVGTDGARFRHAVYTVGADGTDLRRVARTISGPSWSPDGTRLAFVGATDDQGDAWDLLMMAPDGTVVRRLDLAPGWEPHYRGGHDVLTGEIWIPTLAWSPAGDQLLYTCGRRICVVMLDGTPVGRSPLAWPSGKRVSGSVAAWSPDGGRIAVAPSVVWDHRHADLPQPRPLGPALYTMAPDGTDVRVLAIFDAEGEVRPLGPRPADGPVDVTGCAAGVVVAEPAANPGLVQDCETLLQVQAAWQHELNWSPDVPIGEWEGVGLGGSPPRVRELRVWQQVLGPIPPALSALDQLQVLDLGGSVLGGTIPPELGLLSQLQDLNLRGGFLSGTVPGEFGQLTQLVRLDLAYNNLGGPIPPELGELAALRRLELSNNELTGEIPRELGQLANLNEVHLDGNRLTGCVPAGLSPTENYSRWDQGLPRCEAAA